MNILHFLRGLQKTSGISFFLVETANREVESGHHVGLVYEGFFEYRPRPEVKLFQLSRFDKLEFVPDVVHIHSVWSMFSVRAMLWCLKYRVPFVVSPHGCLMPTVFKSGYLKKNLFYYLILKRLLNKAQAIHTTSVSEKNAVENLGVKTACHIIPLGVTIPDRKANDIRKSGRRIHTVLFVGRISHEKGLINLLNSWKAVCSSNKEWVLKIAGPDWFGHRNELEKKIINECIPCVEFIGQVEGEEKDACYRNADVFVLPSPMENFSAVVLEAMSYGIPAIATKGTPWQELETMGCGWWIDQGVEALTVALNDAMRLTDDERKAKGIKAVELARSCYSWETVTCRCVKLYESICKEGKRNE